MKKYKKVIFWTLSAILLIFLLIITADGIISSKAEKAINSLEIDGRRIVSTKVKFCLLGGSLRIKNLRMEGNDSVPSSVIKKVVIKGIGLSDIKGKNISLRSVTVDSPDLTLFLKKINTSKKININLSVNKFSIKNGNLTVYVPNAADTSRLKTANLNLNIKGLHIDSMLKTPASLKMNMDSLSYLFSRKEYTLKIKNINADSRERTFTIDSTALESFLPKYEFAYSSYGHRDWLTFSTGEIAVNGLDYERLFSCQEVTADSVHISGGYVESYKNRKIRVPDRTKPMFQDMIRDIPVKLSMRIIEANDFKARYDELAANGITPGVITFDEINGRFHNVSNIADSISFIKIRTTGRLMGQSRVHAVYYLPKQKNDPRFLLYGQWDKAEIASMNRMVEPLADIKVTSGVNDGLKFKVIGNDYESHTKLTFLYHDLDVAVMKNDLQGELGFITDIANLIIKHDNPDSSGQVRHGEGDTKRDPYRSNFNYIWKSVFTGVMNTVL